MQQFQVRTDLALEATESVRKQEAGDIRGVVMEEYDVLEDVTGNRNRGTPRCLQEMLRGMLLCNDASLQGESDIPTMAVTDFDGLIKSDSESDRPIFLKQSSREKISF